MSNSTNDADLIMPLKRLRALLPTRPHIHTLRKWCIDGVKHTNTGKVVVLESTMEGGRRYSSLAAYYRFRDKLSADS